MPLERASARAVRSDGTFRIGIRPGHLRLAPRDIACRCGAVPARTGRIERLRNLPALHTRQGGVDLVAQLQGVHQIELGTQLDVYIDPDELFVFGADTKLLSGPEAAHGAH